MRSQRTANSSGCAPFGESAAARTNKRHAWSRPSRMRGAYRRGPSRRLEPFDPAVLLDVDAQTESHLSGCQRDIRIAAELGTRDPVRDGDAPVEHAPPWLEHERIWRTRHAIRTLNDAGRWTISMLSYDWMLHSVAVQGWIASTIRSFGKEYTPSAKGRN
jgi:hypothetical protein